MAAPEPRAATEVFARAQLPAKPEEKAVETKAETPSGSSKSAVRSQGASVSRLGVLVLPIVGIVVVVALWTKSPTLALVLVLALVVLPLIFWLLGWLARRKIAARRRQASYGPDGSYAPRGSDRYRPRGAFRVRDRSSGSRGQERRSTRAQRREAADREPVSARTSPRRSLTDRWRNRHRVQDERAVPAQRRAMADHARTDKAAGPGWRQRRAERRAERSTRRSERGGAPPAAAAAPHKSTWRERRAERRAERPSKRPPKHRRESVSDGGREPGGTWRDPHPERSQQKREAREARRQRKQERRRNRQKAPVPAGPDGSEDESKPAETAPRRKSRRWRRRSAVPKSAAPSDPYSEEKTDAKESKPKKRWRRKKSETTQKEDFPVGKTKKRWRDRLRKPRGTLDKGSATPSPERPAVPVVPFSHPEQKALPPVRPVPVPFQVPRQPAAAPLSRVRTSASTQPHAQGSTMTAPVDNPYSHIVDLSTPASTAATLHRAADAARAGAAAFDEKAASWRREVTNNENRKHMADVNAEFLQKAALADRDAETHRGMAAAYEQRAAEAAAGQ